MAKPTTPVRNYTEVITEAHSTVTVTGTDRKRALRDAALVACGTEFGPFTIEEEVNLGKEEVKFSAWITGARGRNGWIVSGKMGRAVVGSTTVEFWAERGMVTNIDVFKASASTPVMSGIIG